MHRNAEGCSAAFKMHDSGLSETVSFCSAKTSCSPLQPMLRRSARLGWVKSHWGSVWFPEHATAKSRTCAEAFPEEHISRRSDQGTARGCRGRRRANAENMNSGVAGAPNGTHGGLGMHASARSSFSCPRFSTPEAFVASSFVARHPSSSYIMDEMGSAPEKLSAQVKQRGFRSDPSAFLYHSV